MQIKKTLEKLAAMNLAEVLIVLTIIGIISALTVPGLKKHSERTQNVQLLKKAYNTLEGAIDYNEANREDFSKSWNNVTPGYWFIALFAKEYLNTSGELINFPNYKAFKASNVVNPAASGYILTDGTIVAGGLTGNKIYIDVNGDSGPNMEGVDVFMYQIGKFNSECVKDSANGILKLCPTGHAKDIMSAGWEIKYWD